MQFDLSLDSISVTTRVTVMISLLCGLDELLLRNASYLRLDKNWGQGAALPTQIMPPKWGHTVNRGFVQADVVGPRRSEDRQVCFRAGGLKLMFACVPRNPSLRIE